MDTKSGPFAEQCSPWGGTKETGSRVVVEVIYYYSGQAFSVVGLREEKEKKGLVFTFPLVASISHGYTEHHFPKRDGFD